MYAAPNIFAMRSGTAMPAGNWRGMPSPMTPPQLGGPTMMPMRAPMPTTAPEGPGMVPPQQMPPQFQPGGPAAGPVAGPMPVRPGLMMPPQPGGQPPGSMPMRRGMPPMVDPRMQNVFAQRSMMPMQRQF